MHKAFWEAIRFEHLIKRYRLWKAKMQEEKSPQSPQTTEVPMVEPVMENVKADVEEHTQETYDFPTNSDEVIDKIPPPVPTLGTLDGKEIDSLSINNDD